MKKTIRVFALLAIILGAGSCQENSLDNGQVIGNGQLTITATIAQPEATRVTYDVDNETSHTITPAWTLGDKIIGFDDDDHTFTFTVESVDGSGRATLSDGGYTPESATKAYAIYYPGKTTANFTGSGASTKLAVDLSSQAGAALNDNAPVLMCATADISGGAISLDFTNQVAIIGVTKFKLPEAGTVTSVDVAGLITTGKFELNGSGNLVLTADETPTTVTASGSWATAGVDNICETPLYFATLPTDDANIVLNASTATKDYANVTSIPTTDIAAGNYYYMAKNFAAAVADINGVKYGTIEAAFDAANTATGAVTLTLLADCTTAARFRVNNSGTGAVTLDLNGHTLTMSEQIRVVGRTLTITDSSSDVLAEQGTINCTYTGGRALYVEESSTLNFAGGTLTNSNTSQALYVISGSTVNMTGGKILATNNACAYVTGTTNISGDAIIASSTSTAVYNYGGTLTVEGNAIITGGSSNYGINTSNSGTTNVRGNARVTGTNAVYGQGGSTVNISGNPTFYSESGATIYAATSTINISGGTASRGGTGNGYVVYSGNAAARINISGGTFSNTEGGVKENPVVFAYTSSSIITVTDGLFKSKGESPIGISEGTVYVSGGKFNKAVNDAFCEDSETNHYVTVANTDPSTAVNYPFKLSPLAATPVKVTVTSAGSTSKFNTVDCAFQNANILAGSASVDATVTLLEDVAASAAMTVSSGNSKTVSINLNGHQLSSAQSPAVISAGKFALNDPVGDGELSTTGATALSVTEGTAAVNSGSVYGATNAVSVTGGVFSVFDGHVYGGGAADIVTTAGTISLSGGYFRYEPDAEWIADGYASAGATETFNTRSYDYQVEVAAAVATVAGADCGSWAAAVAAACSYSGPIDSVLIELVEDISDASAANLTHASKPIVLDLKGHILSTSTAQFLTTTGTLTIKDTEESKGKMTSNKTQMIYLTTSGTINILDCVLECTAAAAAENRHYAENSMISLVGTSKSLRGTLNISGNKTHLYTTNGVQIMRAQGVVNIINGAFTVGSNGNSYYAIYCHNYTAFNVSGEASFRCFNAYPIYCAGTTSVITLDGGYYYNEGGTYDLGAYNNDCGKCYTINDGYYKASKLHSRLGDATLGGTYTKLATPVNHSHAGTSLSYGYRLVPSVP